MLARLNRMPTPEKVFLGFSALVAIIGACLAIFTHQKTIELAAGPANCTIDSAHVKTNGDGTMIVLKGAIVDCDRYVEDPAKARFTVKSELSPLGEAVKRSLARQAG